MRRPLIILPVLTALAALGCEDGPTDMYQAAQPDAGWNSGTPDAAVPTGTQPFDAGYPTSSKTELCSTDFKRQRWAWMLAQPIKPPRFYAGLDMAKNDLWDGLTIDDAETPPSDPNSPTGGLCQSTPLGFEGNCPSGFGGCNGNAWGNNSEVVFSWNVATHLVDQMELTLGYTGTMQTIKYPDHNGELHAYTIGVGDIIRRDGQPYEIQWSDSTTRAIQITDIFNATMATFAKPAGVPFDTSTCANDTMCVAPGVASICECEHAVDANNNPTSSCKAGTMGQCGVKNCGNDGNCLIYNDGSTTIFGVRPMVVYVEGTAGVPQPALSTPQVIYNFFSKWEPFSNLPQTVQLNADGPIASGPPVGIPAGSTTTCTQQIGQTFADFQKTCVQVHGDAADPAGVDAVNLNKVVHSLTHDQEHWTANVLGVNQNFTSMKVLNNPDIVVLDSDTPQPTDVAQDWTFDVRARGHVANDWGKSGYELRGSALMMIEYARLMLADIARILHQPVPKKLGDPSCIGFDGNGQPNYKSTTGCSGIEGMIIPNGATYGANQPDFTGDPLRPDLDAGPNYDQVGLFASLLKPGAVSGAFCIDPATPGYPSDCTANQGVSLWQNALNHVTRVLGNGDPLNLPSELRDRRYYFKWFGIAFVKYLKAYGNYNPATRNNFPNGTVGSGLGPSDVLAQSIDLESLFFDYSVEPGSGSAQTFDKFEYIDRDFNGKGAGGAFNWAPWDFEYGCDLFGGNQRYDNFYRRMDREEIALYSAMLTDKSNTPGTENNVNITNLFGSLLLGGDPASAVAGAFPSYACAIGQAGDPAANCNGGNAPLDTTNPSGAELCTAPTPTGCTDPTQICGGGVSHENGYYAACGAPCDFTAFKNSGCASPSQTCAGGACIDMKMDKNAGAANAHPLLWAYPGVWARTPFSRGHSSVTIAAADKHPNIGVAKASIPNFVTGPYTMSPVAIDAAGACPMGYSKSKNGVWCNAAVNAGTGTLAPAFAALSPWLEEQPGVGFEIPLDAQHFQWISSAQLDFSGVLENYIVDYTSYKDPAKVSCVADGVCNKGFTCDTASHSCVTDDDTISVSAIEGADFLGQAFVCMDPSTGDILHVGMYDSALAIVDWLAAHPGSSGGGGPAPSAQDACQILVIRSPYDNFVDQIVSKSNGVSLNVSGGQGQGRVTDVILFDPTLIQAL